MLRLLLSVRAFFNGSLCFTPQSSIDITSCTRRLQTLHASSWDGADDIQIWVTTVKFKEVAYDIFNDFQ